MPIKVDEVDYNITITVFPRYQPRNKVENVIFLFSWNFDPLEVLSR